MVIVQSLLMLKFRWLNDEEVPVWVQQSTKVRTISLTTIPL